eukprot:SAG31_NODE_18212_length_643_cov_1.154412_2_plen_71_part_01
MFEIPDTASVVVTGDEGDILMLQHVACAAALLNCVPEDCEVTGVPMSGPNIDVSTGHCPVGGTLPHLRVR